MRQPIAAFAILLLATTACSRVAPDDGEPRGTAQSDSVANSADASEVTLPPEFSPYRDRPIREAGPQVGPETAPGVAFAYRYAFRLEADRVAEVQQEHQRLCERLTIARCRITGMVYRAASDDDVEAMLAFRVDPAVAGQFGREGVRAALDAEGTLADSEITGNEGGGAIDAAGRDLAALEAEQTRLQARLAGGGLDREERGRIDYDLQMLHQQIADLRGNRATQRQSLATTPILFRYGSGSLAPGGYQATPSLGEAWKDTADDFLASLNLLLVLLVRLLPWLAAALIVFALVRFVHRRLQPKAAPGSDS